ncbi:MAG: tetratricopeptide repeat protein [Bdellovibrionales bacterium]
MKVSQRILIAALFLPLVLAACEKPEEKYDKYMKRGAELYDQKEYKTARLEYKNAARLKPADAEVRYRLGLIDEAQGNLTEAFKNFIATEQQDAHHKAALQKLVQYFIAGDQLEEAQKRTDILLQEAPNDGATHALSSALHLQHKEYDATEREAYRALSLEGENVIAYTVLTGLYLAKGDEAKASSVVEEGVSKNPTNVSLLLLKAMVYEKKSQVDKVAEAYKVIFNLKPKDKRFRDDLAEVYVNAKQIDSAEKVLRDGVAAMPDDWSMKKRFVDFLDHNRGIEEAEKTIKAYMETYPDNPDLIFWLADLYISHKDINRAIVLLQEVVQQADAGNDVKHSLTARASLARIHFVKGDRALAEKLVQAVLEQDPNNVDALFIQAQLLYDLGDYQQAIVVLRTVVRDHPEFSEALQLLGESLLSQGHLDLAMDTFVQLTQIAPEDLPSKVRLAQIYAAHDEPENGIKLLSLVTKADPKYSVGWESLARIAIQMKRWDLALSAIDELEKINGQQMTGAFLRGQIEAEQVRYPQAIELFKKIISADPTAPIAEHALLAFASASQQAGTSAEALLYLRSFPENLGAVQALIGRIYQDMKEVAPAKAAYKRAIDDKVQDVEPYLALAQLEIKDGQTESALGLLDQAQSLFVMDFRPDLLRAEVLMSLSRYDEALVIYERVLARNPDFDAVANNAAQIIADHQAKDPAALEHARVLAERFIRSTNPSFLDTLGWVYFLQGKVDQAQTIYERILSYQGKLPVEVYYHYGVLLAQAGRKAEAALNLQKALDSKEDFNERGQAQTLLKSL